MGGRDISPQQERENPDSVEKFNPAPGSMLVLVLVLVLVLA